MPLDKAKCSNGGLVSERQKLEGIQKSNRETNLEAAVCHELVHRAIGVIKFGVRVEKYDGLLNDARYIAHGSSGVTPSE